MLNPLGITQTWKSHRQREQTLSILEPENSFLFDCFFPAQIPFVGLAKLPIMIFSPSFFALGCVGPSSPKLEIQFSCISPWPCKNLHQHIVMLNCGFETTRICGAWAHLVHKLGTYYLEQLMALFGPISEPITIFNFMCINHFNIQLFNKIFYLVKSIEHNFTHRHLGIWVLLIQVVLIQNNVSLNYNFLFQEKTLSFQQFRLCM